MAIGVEDEALGHPSHTEIDGVARVRVDQVWVDTGVLRQIMPHLVGTVLVDDPQKLHLVAVVPRGLLQELMLGLTRVAPSCPEIEHRRLAMQGRYVERLAVHAHHGERRRLLAL